MYGCHSLVFHRFAKDERLPMNQKRIFLPVETGRKLYGDNWPHNHYIYSFGWLIYICPYTFPICFLPVFLSFNVLINFVNFCNAILLLFIWCFHSMIPPENSGFESSGAAVWRLWARHQNKRWCAACSHSKHFSSHVVVSWNAILLRLHSISFSGIGD